MSLSPAERSARARMGAYAQQAQHDTRETTASARAAFLSRFEREVDPNNELVPAERDRRAEAARKAYFAGLTLARLRSRARNKQTTGVGRSVVCGSEEVDDGDQLAHSA
jgi:hypothetical protein